VLIGTGVLALLLLLVLLAERGGERMWQDHQSPARFYCEPCDLRYRRDELIDQTDRVCPRGHYVEKIRKGFSLGTAAIFTCLTFLAVAAILTYTGAVPILP
jgi:hypothetical protein